jgi:hypothetical protein
MSESKYTCGPWVTFVDRSSGEDVFDILPAMRDGEIAHNIRNAHDAALIAAAPGMLEALQDIVRLAAEKAHGPISAVARAARSDCRG